VTPEKHPFHTIKIEGPVSFRLPAGGAGGQKHPVGQAILSGGGKSVVVTNSLGVGQGWGDYFSRGRYFLGSRVVHL